MPQGPGMLTHGMGVAAGRLVPWMPPLPASLLGVDPRVVLPCLRLAGRLNLVTVSGSGRTGKVR